MLDRRSGLFGAALLVAIARPALAADCAPASGASSCIDANGLWLRPGADEFLSIGISAPLERTKVSLAVATEFLLHPLSLGVPSPSPEGREVFLVNQRLEWTTLIGFGLGDELEAAVALPLVLRQTGAGSEGITSQRAPPIDSSAARDPRLTLLRHYSFSPLELVPRLDLTVPLGDESAYAGDSSFVVAPGAGLAWAIASVTLGLDLGARLRRSVELGTLRYGSSLSVALGARVELFAPDRLWLTAEAWAMPSLIDERSQRARALGTELRALPAEWLASVGYRPVADDPLFLSVAGGSGIPLSEESWNTKSDSFAGAPSPRLRLLALIGYRSP